MPAWLFFALLAPALFALTNILDKLLTKRFSGASLNVAAGLSVGLALLAIPFLDVNIPLLIILVGLVGGAFWFLGGFPYFKAMAIEDP